MNRVYAIFLLVVYSLFSSFAVASSHVYTEVTSEGTEKEVITSNFPEHREVNSVRLTGKQQAVRLRHNFLYEGQDDKLNRPFSLSLLVPIYILHCIYRL